MPDVPIKVPSVGESISEGIVSRWLKADGSSVQAGEPLLELETDKATSVVPAPGTGILKIGIDEGQTVAIGATVGTIEPPGSPAIATPGPAATAQPGHRPDGQGAGPKEPEHSAPKNETLTATPTVGPGTERPPAPSVRRLVAEHDVDLARVAGTGPGGRVTKGDVLTFLESEAAAPQPAAESRAASPSPRADLTPATAEPAALGSAGAKETRKRMSGLRQRIAERLVQAQHTAAILTTFNEADMSRVIELRSRHKESFQKAHGIPLGFMSFFVKASIEALRAFPAVNARIEGAEIVYQHVYDIGVAVSTERGLLVPVIRGADRLSFAAIEKTIAAFAVSARAGTISIDDLRGGTFTITNGGVFGSLLSTPILNPPQSGILGMHVIKNRPVVVDEQIVVRPIMYLALSYDHRLIDGREAVGFLVRVKDCIENPERMMLEI
jgi:2-oxoglutarate dehydrogenase E2 component (dihydrolipoamide succinyltransferase)